MKEGPTVYTDEEILQALAGSREQTDHALRYLYRAYFDFLTVYVLQNSGSEHDAADLFQEVMIVFTNLVKAGKFRGEASIRTFLFALNRNLWLNELKKRGRAKTREERYESIQPTAEDPVVKALEYGQSSKVLIGAMDALGANCKTILLQYYFEKRSIREILASLPYENEQVVRNTKAKCLKKLAEQLSASALYAQLKTVFYG